MSITTMRFGPLLSVHVEIGPKLGGVFELPCDLSVAVVRIKAIFEDLMQSRHLPEPLHLSFVPYVRTALLMRKRANVWPLL